MIYEKIRNMREDNDITHSNMAANLSIHQTTYSDYELGNLNIPIPIIIKIADFYNTSVDYLVGRTNIKKAYPRNVSEK